MGKRINKSGDNSMKTNAKLDKLLEIFEESEKKAAKRHEEIRKELKTIEGKHAKLQKEVKKCRKRERDLEVEMSKMKETVNSLEQDKLSKNLVFKGIKEVPKESDPKFTLALAQYLVNYLFKKPNNKIDVVAARRIGIVRDKNKPQMRPIVAQFRSIDAKMEVLKAAKEAPLNCNLILMEDGPVGTVEDKIYVNEHLTQLNTTLFFEARKMKREKHIQFAWVKNGAVLVKKSESSRAIRLKSLNHLSVVKKSLGIKKIISSTINDSDNGSSTESESEQSYGEDGSESSSSVTVTKTPEARGEKRKSTPQTDERTSRRPRRAATSKNSA